MCCALLPNALLPLPQGHELFALLAFLGLCLGVTCRLAVVENSFGSNHGRGTPPRIRALFRGVLPLLPLLPLVLAGLTQAYLTLERPDLPWVSPRWRTLGISPFLSFGWWEWISAAVLSTCLLVLWRRPLAVVDRE